MNNHTISCAVLFAVVAAAFIAPVVGQHELVGPGAEMNAGAELTLEEVVAGTGNTQGGL